MKYSVIVLLLTLLLIFSSACSRKQYVVTNIESSYIEMNSTWDKNADPEITKIVDHYKNRLGNEMNIEIGEAVQTMTAGYPQSLLTNLTADVMKEYANSSDLQKVDFAVVNVGGLRSTLNKGKITIGNLFEIYSFDNELVILDIPGKAVRELFDFYAVNGGQGLSSGVQLIVKNKVATSLKINGKEINDQQQYRVVTLDYLAEGNDGMIAFKEATGKTKLEVTLRDVMINYVKKCTIEGKKVNSSLDDRITIQ